VRRQAARRPSPRAGAARAALAATTTATTTVLVLLTPGTVDTARTPGADLSALVAACAVGLGWLVAAHLVVTTVAVLASAVPGGVGAVGRRIADTVSPRFARSAVRIACGVAVAGAPLAGAGTALAEPSDPAAGTRVVATTGVRVVPATVPVLDRQVVAATPPTTPTTSEPSRGRVVVVRPGDSLWSIAADRLGPRATDAQVAVAWPRWYAANADVIGPDPGLIRPGQHLRVPGPVGDDTRAAS
jgi:hypothetical protein